VFTRDADMISSRSMSASCFSGYRMPPVKKAVCRYDLSHFCFRDLASVSYAVLCNGAGCWGDKEEGHLSHDGGSEARESIVSTTVDRTKQT
jgi:hypothetical protein